MAVDPTLVVAAALLAFVYFVLLRKRPADINPLLLKHQSCPSAVRKKGESAIYRHRTTPEGAPLFQWHPDYPDVRTLYDAFNHGLKAGNGLKKPCLGSRVNDGPFIFENYGEVLDRIQNFGSGLLECGLKPKQENFVGVFAKNCAEWVITELSASFYGLIVVPLYDTLGPDAIKFILNQTQTSVVVVEPSKLQHLLTVAPQCPSLKYVVKIGTLTAEDKKMAQEAKVTLLYFKGVEALGKDAPKKPAPPSPSDTLTICYTSGTTGDPKGVIITHANVVAEMAGVLSTLPTEIHLNEHDVHLSFLPLAHIFEQLVMCALVSVGASIAFYRGDILKLLDDVGEAKPTLFPAVPRLLNRIYTKIMSTINDSGAIKKALFYRALNAKQQLLREGICTKNTFWDRLVFRKVQARLGGRVKLLLSGAAPISPEVLDFFRAAFGCPVMEGYGQTETCAAITLTHANDYAQVPGGHVGPILPCNEVKLVDIPDMGYLATDQPNPRGEICVRGHNLFKGYYKEPKKTAETIDSDGWCHTGDVGTFLPNGCLKIIDRKKHIFKLAQGEYIAPEKIENIYLKAPLVAQVFVHGESLKNFLVGVIVPDFDQLHSYAKKVGKEQKSDEELCKDSEVQTYILQGLIDAGKKAKLHSFEQIRFIYLHPELFTPENGFLTPSFKAKRDVLRKHFAKQIEDMYAKDNSA